MTGLLDGWQNRATCRIHCETTSADGEYRVDNLDGIRLALVLAEPVTRAVMIRSADGAGFMLPAADVADTYLVQNGGIWVVVPAHDTNRRRWLKTPVSFQVI